AGGGPRPGERRRVRGRAPRTRTARWGRRVRTLRTSGTTPRTRRRCGPRAAASRCWRRPARRRAPRLRSRHARRRAPARPARSGRGGGPSSGEPRRALLEERGEALTEVLAAARQLHGERFRSQLLIEGVLAGDLQHPLGQPEGDGGPGGELLGERNRGAVDVRRRDGDVAEAPLDGGGARDSGASEKQLTSPLHPD